ncbi:MAG: DNRLRE domain-containing protein [Acidimicrobiales bacterium]
MRWRWACALLLPAGYGVFFAPLAAGDPSVTEVTTTVLATQSTWYWREQVSNVQGTGVAPPVPLTDPSVPSGDLAVSGPEVNGQPDKETYLEFDVSALPPGSTISSFVVTLPVDSSAQTALPTATPPPIVACAPQGSWSGGQGGQSFSGRPAEKCATDAPKFTSSDGGKSYKADITSIAQGWTSGGAINFGVAVTDDPANTSTAYQVVFGPAASIARLTASVTYEPASSAGGGVSSGDTTTGSTVFAGGSFLSGLPSVPVPTGSAATPTTTAPVAPTRSRALRSAAPAGAGAVPPAGFWIVGLLLLAVLLASSLVLGDEPRPVMARARRRLAAAGSLAPSVPTAQSDR